MLFSASSRCNSLFSVLTLDLRPTVTFGKKEMKLRACGQIDKTQDAHPLWTLRSRLTLRSEKSALLKIYVVCVPHSRWYYNFSIESHVCDK